jgi:hypothetical protein
LECINCRQAADTLQQLSCRDLKSKAPWSASRVRSCYKCKAGLKAKNSGVDCACKLLNELSKDVTETTFA